jgi:hypothetical protein
MRYLRVGQVHHLNPAFVPKARQAPPEPPQAEPGPPPPQAPEAATGAPSRGLGDTVAKVLEATGVARVVKAVAGENCGCKKRQEALNRLVPYSESK